MTVVIGMVAAAALFVVFGLAQSRGAGGGRAGSCDGVTCHGGCHFCSGQGRSGSVNRGGQRE